MIVMNCGKHPFIKYKEPRKEAPCILSINRN
jgi:hypothetical protein